MKTRDEFVTKSYFEEKFSAIEERFNKLEEKFAELFKKIDWFMGKYEKFDQEQTLTSNKISDIEDRVEKVEKHVGIVI